MKYLVIETFNPTATTTARKGTKINLTGPEAALYSRWIEPIDKPKKIRKDVDNGFEKERVNDTLEV